MKRIVYYCFIILFSLCACSKTTGKEVNTLKSTNIDTIKFKEENKIVLEDDLDGDGMNELVQSFNFDVNLSPVLFHKEGKGYTLCSADKNLKINTEMTKGYSSVYDFGKKGSKMIAYIGALCCKYIEGKSYPSNNLILIYQFKDGKYILRAQYFSEYDGDDAGNVTKKTDFESAPMGRYPFEKISLVDNGEQLYIKGFDFNNIIDSNGVMKRLDEDTAARLQIF
jgi:hypothetical protein